MMKGKSVVVWLVIIMAIPLFSCGKKDNPVEDPWKEFISQEGRFSINMPGEPTYSKQAAPIGDRTMDIHMFLISHGVMAYGVMHNDVPAEIVNVQEYLDTRGAAAVKTSGGSQVVTKKISIDSYPGLEIKFLTSDKKQYTGRLFFVNGRLYQVIATAPAGVNADAAVAKFMDSFKLLK
jgi:hypothetical protein